MASKAVLNKAKRINRIKRKLQSRKLIEVARAVYPEYHFNWFHELLADYLEKWANKEIRKLAIFVPPQHGKSTFSSILTPAFIHGHQPKAKVVCASYIQTISAKFCRATQDVMRTDAYHKFFPGTMLPKESIERNGELQNQAFYETVGHKGSYKAVGIEGGLTSDTVEFGIIDDPIKDRKTANSAAYRDALWNWYIDVFRTRLNNDSCELMLFTRWHQDDLAGRLFDPKNEHYDEKRAKEFKIIVLPALKEADNVTYPIPGIERVPDPRKAGEALWPEKHSAEAHEDDKRNNPYTFASLKQQRPSPLAGGLLKRSWFQVIKKEELPFNPGDPAKPIPVHFIIDGAFSEKAQDDPSAIIAYWVYQGNLYIKHCISMKLTLDKYLPFLNRYFQQQGHGVGSRIRIEKKSSGPALSRMLSTEQYGQWSTEGVSTLMVSWGKYTRGEFATPALASGKVFVIQGSWNEHFISQCTTFPNDVNDDEFDCLCFAVLTEIQKQGAKKLETSISLSGPII